MRVVRATSKEEFDTALATADQVIVEGDDELLSYAATKASHDPQLSSVDVEVRAHSVSVGRTLAAGKSAVATADFQQITERMPKRRSPASSAARRSRFLPLVLGIFIVLVILNLVILYIEWSHQIFFIEAL